MTKILTMITVVLVAVVVVVLVVYLLFIIYHLWRAGNHLEKLAGGLQKIEDDTAPLKEKVDIINGALTQLVGGLGSVDGHLVSIAKVLKLV